LIATYNIKFYMNIVNRYTLACIWKWLFSHGCTKASKFSTQSESNKAPDRYSTTCSKQQTELTVADACGWMCLCVDRRLGQDSTYAPDGNRFQLGRP
jgi:hypothetical protein